jgi:hypothetical protein
MPDFEQRELVRSLRRVAYALPKGEKLTWVDVRRIEHGLGVSGSRLRAALGTGQAQGLLVVEGAPAVRIALRDAGVAGSHRIKAREVADILGLNLRDVQFRPPRLVVAAPRSSGIWSFREDAVRKWVAELEAEIPR